MKKIYRRILGLLGNLPVMLEIIKTFIAEWVAIIRKRPLYKHIKWTKEQQKEFDEYWKKNYGKKISNRWHKLYEASNGVFRVDYFPEILFTTKLEPKVNNYQYSHVFSDKSLLDLLFNNRIENVRVPETYVFNNRGLFYDGNHHLISKEKAVELVSDIGDAVIKPIIDSSSGNDVSILNIKDGKNTKDGKTIQDIFDYYGSNFIIQEKILPNKAMATLYPGAINTMRITSYIVDDKVDIVPISLRVGSGGGVVDNIHAGGIGINVSSEGVLNKYAYKLGYGNNFEKLEKHPDTQILFDGYKLDFIPDLIEIAKSLHQLTPNLQIISWDFTVDENGCIVVVEANYRGQGSWFPQMISGKALFGENTEKVLQHLRK